MNAGWADFLPVLSVGVIGSCAADVYEPRQGREDATVNGPLWVPQGCLITLTGRTGRKSVFSVIFFLSTRVDALISRGCGKVHSMFKAVMRIYRREL